MQNSEPVQFRITNGFVLTFSLLFAVCGPRGGMAIVLCALIHELAHIAAVRICGGQITAFFCETGGFSIKHRFLSGVSYGRECFCLAAGAVSNLLAGVLLAYIHTGNTYLYMLAGANMTVGLFNLVPAGCFDGGRILYLCAEYCAGPQRAQKVCAAVSLLTAALVLLGGMLLYVRSGRSLTVLLTALYLSFLLGYDIIDHILHRNAGEV